MEIIFIKNKLHKLLIRSYFTIFCLFCWNFQPIPTIDYFNHVINVILVTSDNTRYLSVTFIKILKKLICYVSNARTRSSSTLFFINGRPILAGHGEARAGAGGSLPRDQ